MAKLTLPKLSQKNIFLISGISIFLSICLIFSFYWNSSNSAKISQSNSQNSVQFANQNSTQNSISSISVNPNSLNNSSQNSQNLSLNSSTNDSKNSSQFTISASISSLSTTQNLQIQKDLLTNLSQKITKIDILQKPFLLTETQILGQNKENLLPINLEKNWQFQNLKPIWVESEKTIYFPYSAGFIAKINTESGEVKWDIFDFPISQMSLFNGNYYLTEYKEKCEENTGQKCRILEINRKDLTKKKVLMEINNSDLYVVFANAQNFWVSSGFGTAGEAGILSIDKYKNNLEFIERLEYHVGLGYVENLPLGAGPNCANVWIEEYTKTDQKTVLDLELEFEKNKKEIWTSPYNGCKTVEDQQKGKNDQTGSQIFQSKFPFLVEMTNINSKPISCQKFEYKESKEKDYYQLLYNGEEYQNNSKDKSGEIPITCIQ